jgi:hypothetical protein
MRKAGGLSCHAYVVLDKLVEPTVLIGVESGYRFEGEGAEL